MYRLEFSKSKNKLKKYKVIVYKNNKKYKVVNFGSITHQHFKDTTPLKLYSNLDHNDNKRRLNYFKRHKKNYPKYSADYFSKKYLWSKK